PTVKSRAEDLHTAPPIGSGVTGRARHRDAESVMHLPRRSTVNAIGSTRDRLHRVRSTGFRVRNAVAVGAQGNQDRMTYHGPGHNSGVIAAWLRGRGGWMSPWTTPQPPRPTHRRSGWRC